MNDAEIIELYWNRSEFAIRETERKYGRLCRNIAANVLGCEEDVEECLNDTYLGVWNAIPPEKPVSLTAYICRIARNLALKKYEHASAAKRNAKASLSLDELEECIPGTDSPFFEEGELLVKTLNKFLRSLDPDSRNIFLRRYWHFDSIDDIARRYGVSKSKVTSLLFRARNKLKNELAEEGVAL